MSHHHHIDENHATHHVLLIRVVSVVMVMLEVFQFIALIFIMRVDSSAEHTDEVSEEPLVHVPGHLVEDQPVTLGAVLDVVVDVSVILILLEVSSDLPLDQQVSECNQF